MLADCIAIWIFNMTIYNILPSALNFIVSYKYSLFLFKLVLIFLFLISGRHKCREEWESPSSRILFNLFLDMILLLIPLIIMSLAYSLIVSKLWKGLQRELRHNSSCKSNGMYNI